MIYACGLRISEAVHLRKADVDSNQNRQFIKAGKGKKDRYIFLPQNLEQLLQRSFRNMISISDNSCSLTLLLHENMSLRLNG